VKYPVIIGQSAKLPRNPARRRPATMNRAIKDNHYVCTTWFERDRKHIRLETPKGRLVFDLWDEAVSEAIEDGFLSAPRHPRPGDEDWQPCAVAYAKSQRLIKSR
jgi:hypothetical protein